MPKPKRVRGGVRILALAAWAQVGLRCDLAPSLTELEDGGASRIGHGNTVVRVVCVAEGWAGEEEVA